MEKIGQIRKCLICKKEFYVCPSVKKRFCSHKCQGVSFSKQELRHCLVCKKEFYTPPSRDQRYCSYKCAGVTHWMHSGKNHPQWKGEDASYRTIHQWLKNNFGLAKQCEYCKVLPNNFRTAGGLPVKRYPIQYALIHGKKHSHKRENYICLCYKCHGEYDKSIS